jgi:hypothetical protein
MRLETTIQYQTLRHAAGRIVPSDRVIKVRMPTVAEDAANLTTIADEVTEEDTSNKEFLSEHRDAEVQARGEKEPYREVDLAGVPQPLAQGLLTLSWEGAAKWESLVHLDAIKVCST